MSSALVLERNAPLPGDKDIQRRVSRGEYVYKDEDVLRDHATDAALAKLSGDEEHERARTAVIKAREAYDAAQSAHTGAMRRLAALEDRIHEAAVQVELGEASPDDLQALKDERRKLEDRENEAERDVSVKREAMRRLEIHYKGVLRAARKRLQLEFNTGWSEEMAELRKAHAAYRKVYERVAKFKNEASACGCPVGAIPEILKPRV